MLKRSILAVIVVSATTAAIVFSQWHSRPLQVSGFLEADEIRLGSRVGGRVQSVHVQEGDSVHRGMILVQLEPFDLLEQEQHAIHQLAARDAEFQRLREGFRAEEIAQAKARHNQLQARLALLTAGPRPQEIEAAQGRLAIADAELKLARQTFDRVSRLQASGATSQEELDQAIERLEAAQSAVIVRQQELYVLQAGTRQEELLEAEARVEEARQGWLLAQQGFRKEEIEQAHAAGLAAEAELAAIRQRIAELTIISPVSGTVEALELQPGDLVAAGAPVMAVIDTSRLWVRAYIPQSHVATRVGDNVWIQVDGFPSERFRGEVTYVARQAEFMPSNVQTPEERSKQVFRVKVTLREGMDRLRPGMAADVLLNDPSSPNKANPRSG